ncbi:MAG TPA: cell division protein FtsZ, partial [bacterium]|nr:cell division protein FtsZ [bacterium]
MKTPKRLSPKIKIVGVGGAGSNTVSRLMRYNLEGIELIALNTDEQDLKRTSAHLKIRIGRKLTQGLGAGMNPKLGEKAAEEQKEEIKEALKGAQLIFITLG